MSEQHARAAHARGKARSAKIEEKVEKAMSDIVTEMKENNGIYPKNGGAVSKNEVARRAGINATTLFSKKQKELGERVTLWLATLKQREIVGRMRVRRDFAERANDWKALYNALLNTNLQCELELQSAVAERDEARAEAAKLQQANDSLVHRLGVIGGSKVKSITRKEV